jgi:hypothetical protein
MSAMTEEDTRQRILGSQDVHNLGKALLTLTSELWIVRDRLMVLEHVLGEQGTDVASLVDNHVPDAALQARLDAERRRITKAITDALVDEGNTSGVFDR